MEQRPAIRTGIAGALAIGGGILVAVASRLEWGKIFSVLGPIGRGATVKGGSLELGLGLAIAALGVLMFVFRSDGWRLGLALSVMLGGVILIGLGIYFASSDSAYLRTVAASDRQERILEVADDRGVIDVSRDSGLYLALAGGAVGWLGGLFELMARGRKKRQTPPIQAEGPVAGWGPVPPGGPGAPEPPPPPPAPGPPPDVPLPGQPFEE